MSKPQVTILLATYNGESYLHEQLNSIIQQTIQPLKIIASDDASTDRTLEILRAYPIEIHQGPCRGVAANFMHLIEKANETSEYYAFSDQDDVWDLDKLQRGIVYLSTIHPDKPALYCTRTLLVNEELKFFSSSPLYKKKPSFLNALVQNIGGGNTMIFNRRTLELLRQTDKKHTIVSHDWWTYLLTSGAGGTVIYDPIPSLLYRQHKGNLIGYKKSWRTFCYRILMLFRGRIKSWIDINNKHLLDISHILTAENKQQLEVFEFSRQRLCVPRLIKIMQLGVYRQTRLEQIGLLIGLLFNKI